VASDGIERPAHPSNEGSKERDGSSRRFEPFPGVTVYPEQRRVELEAEVCLDRGWLEQVACAAGSREHESLVVPVARPSQIHAALLTAGFEPGTPGSWTYEQGEYEFVAPTGSPVQVHVSYRAADGTTVEEPIRHWIHVRRGADVLPFPERPWIFGGSRIEPNPDWMGPGEHYVADVTGSIIGIVTFGDEVLGFSRVLADQASVQPPEWEAATERMPPVGTRVTLILLPPDAR
jgi:hypothetical protein